MRTIFLLLILTTLPLLSDTLTTNKKGVDWLENTPSLLTGLGFSPGYDETGMIIRTGILSEQALFFKPSVGISLHLGYVFNYLTGEKGEITSPDGSIDGNGNPIPGDTLLTTTLHEFQFGLGIKTYRVGQRTGRVYPLNFLLEGALQLPRSRYSDGGSLGSVITSSGDHVIIPKFTVETGIHKEVSTSFTYNLLFYAGAEFFWLQDNLAPQPSLGVKFQPVFRNSLIKTN